MRNKTSRRDFIGTTIKTGIGLSLLSTGLLGCSKPRLNILILGGTSFLGIHQVAFALERGHKVSIFTRGKTIPSLHKDLFKKVEHLIGDRKDNLKSLENRQWDVVIDNSGREVGWTEKSAKLLKDSCSYYLYTSSTGVYYPYLGENIKEDTKLLHKMPEVFNDEWEKLEYGYGIMKANSELAALKYFGKDRTIIVRPTYMFGPADKTNRFIHWPIKLSQGGEVLVPGKKDDPVQYIDVRDVASWMIRLCEEKRTGTFNAVGPKEQQSISEFAHEAAKAFDVKHKFIQVDDYDFLISKDIYGIVPWIMPIGNNFGSARINNSKGLRNGLNIRPLEESMKDTYQWWMSDSVSQSQRDQVRTDYQEVLNEWKSR
ncbi:NAD-dependent epimerase/dehydratase family protein [Flavobacteriaceae bacterium]|nr:NAD-dependent epimerase/dehydratase family protein [Flavobacteriaceae bacterium]